MVFFETVVFRLHAHAAQRHTTKFGDRGLVGRVVGVLIFEGTWYLPQLLVVDEVCLVRRVQLRLLAVLGRME
jgi:hypothetical protein